MNTFVNDKRGNGRPHVETAIGRGKREKRRENHYHLAVFVVRVCRKRDAQSIYVFITHKMWMVPTQSVTL